MLPVVSMLPQQWQVLARLSVSALVASLPLLYVSLLRPPPSALPGDTAFWFLMSNCVVAAIVAADDAGTLFSGSKNHEPRDDGGGDNLSYVSGCQPVAFEDSRRDAVVPSLAASHDELPPTAVNMEGGLLEGELASTMASSNSMDRVLPFLIQGEEEDDDVTASKPGTDMNHASVPQQFEEDVAAIEPITEKNSTVKVEGQGGGGEEEGIIASPSPASDEVIPVDELAMITKQADRALAEPEPWPSLVITSKSLVEEVQEHDEAADEWPVPRYSRTADVLQDESTAAARKGNLRRSATEGSMPAAEESEYWELSDEELNRRVEEFIARFNREMRLQIEQEAGV